MARPLFLILGLICVGIGAIGLVLPLLPTTPFVLLGAMCFARSSSSLHNWLVGHRVFGKLIADWHAEGSIAPRVKIVAVSCMIATLGISVALGFTVPILLVQTGVLSLVAVFILSRPTPSR